MTQGSEPVIEDHYGPMTAQTSLAEGGSTSVALELKKGSFWQFLVSLAGFEDQFLDSPVQEFAHVEFVFRRTRHLVHPAKLFELLAGFS